MTSDLVYTIPDFKELERRAAGTPQVMVPHASPMAVVAKGILFDHECDDIQKKLGELETYKFSGCDAVTRECEADPSLDLIENVARRFNSWYWRFILNPGQHSWMQTYRAGSSYHKHTDGSPGQMRKLTAVALLSHPLSYDGGKLLLYVYGKTHEVPRTRGTIVVFQPWVEHEVTEITGGERQTINMGFWGPPFV